MYNALILIDLSDLPVLDNKKIHKKNLHGIFVKGLFFLKNNLIKRNWHGSKTCVFCTHNEMIKHLFFQCNFARSI
jgi:hypothetical protein